MAFDFKKAAWAAGKFKGGFKKPGEDMDEKPAFGGEAPFGGDKPAFGGGKPDFKKPDMDKDEWADENEDEEGEEKIIDDLSEKFEAAQKLVEDGDNEDLKTIFNEMKDLMDKLEGTHEEK